MAFTAGRFRSSLEAEALYDLLEREVVPEFYARDEAGIPRAWVARMRESMARLTSQFSTDRSVREYTERYYSPAAAAYRRRAADRGAVGAQIVGFGRALEQNWATLHFGEVSLNSNDEQHVFEVQVHLGDLDPGAVRIELYANGVDGAAAEHVAMERVRLLTGVPGGYVYGAAVSARRPPGDYVARAIPHFDDIALPLEEPRILWQR